MRYSSVPGYVAYGGVARALLPGVPLPLGDTEVEVGVGEGRGGHVTARYSASGDKNIKLNTEQRLLIIIERITHIENFSKFD